MLSWKTFLEKKGENLEDMEEKLGKDLDGDKEKGESKAHKNKIFGKRKASGDDEEDETPSGDQNAPSEDEESDEDEGEN